MVRATSMLSCHLVPVPLHERGIGAPCEVPRAIRVPSSHSSLSPFSSQSDPGQASQLWLRLSLGHKHQRCGLNKGHGHDKNPKFAKTERSGDGSGKVREVCGARWGGQSGLEDAVRSEPDECQRRRGGRRGFKRKR